VTSQSLSTSLELGKVSGTNNAAFSRAMTEKLEQVRPEPSVTPQDVERVLAVGRLLLSVLTDEELEMLHQALEDQSNGQRADFRIGNASGS
jgi:hypothetical protein